MIAFTLGKAVRLFRGEFRQFGIDNKIGVQWITIRITIKITLAYAVLL